MSVRVTTSGASSMRITSPDGRPYRLRRGEWTELRKPEDARAFLSPTPHGHILRTERELAPYFVTANGDEQVQARCRYDWTPHRFNLRPGKWTQVDRVAYLYLIRQRDKVRGIKAAEVLKEIPDARVLIQRDMGLGDLMFLTAAVRALKRAFPRARVYLACYGKFRGLMANTGLFESVYDFFSVYDGAPFHTDADLRNWVEMHPKQWKVIRTELFADGLGVSCEGDYRMAAQPGAAIDLPDNPVAIDLAGSMWSRSPPYDKCREIVEAVAAAGFTPVGVMGRTQAWWPDAGENRNGCSLDTLVSILSHSAVLSVDTGTLHLGNALGRPAVGLFGPVKAELRVQGQPNCITIDSPGPCRACCFAMPMCNERTRAQCFKHIPTERIVEALRQVTQ